MSEVNILKISGSTYGNNGSYVLLTDYCEVQAERDALAAENAALKSVKLPKLELAATLTLKDGEYEWDRICYIPDGEHDLYIMKEDVE